MSFPVEVADGNVTSWDRYSVTDPGFPNETHSWGKQVSVPGGGSVYVGVQSSAKFGHHRQHGKVEFNPSRVLEPESWGLASVEHALSTVPAAAAAACQLLRPVDADPRSWNVKRLDVARDFDGVDEPAQLIRSLGALPRRWSRLNQTHADPKRHGAQTLYVGSKAGGVRLYDKAAETMGEAPEGTVRWETEARQWVKNYGGMKLLGDVDRGAVERLARDRWEWSQMGAEVAGSMARLVKVVYEADMTTAQKRSFLGYLVEQSAGVESVLSSKTTAKYRRLQRELGIAAPANLGAMVEVVRRLDWESGREVVGVKAA